MAKLTLRLSDEVLRSARQRAMDRGISIDTLVEESLGAQPADREAQREAIRQILDRASRSMSSSQGRRWTRDELHERD